MIFYRPHHFLCTLGFQGMGYSPDYVKNFQQIAETLRGAEGYQQLIQVVEHTDDICAPCPHRRGKKCTSQATIESLDTAHSRILNLKNGDVITWGEAKAKLRDHMTIVNFHQACEPCSWKALGVCEAALIKLIEN